MDSRIFTPSIRHPRAPRHEAGSTPRHLIPCRYFARGYCSRGDSCLFSHSFRDPIQSQRLQGEHRTIVPFWNNYTIFSPQPYTEHHCETRRSSLSPQPIVVPPPSPSSSSVTTPDDASPIFSFQSTEGSSPTPSAIISDIVPANSTLAIPTRTSVTSDGDTSCYEFSMTYSDVKRDEFLSPPADVHFAELYPLPSHSPIYFTPIPYVQRGFGYRDRHARGRDNRRRRTKVTLTSTPKSHQQREGSGSLTLVAQGATPCKSDTTSDSDGTSVKPHRETWRVIGGGVMLGTATNITSRRKLKRLQLCTRAAEEERSNGLYEENLEFSNLVASVKLTIDRPPLPDIVERPKSSLPLLKVSPLAALFAHAEVA